MCYPRRSQLIPLRGKRLAKIGAGLQTGAKRGNFAGTTDDYHRDTSLTGTLQLLEPLRRKIADQRPRELSPNNSRSTKSGCAKFPGSDATVLFAQGSRTGPTAETDNLACHNRSRPI